MAKDPKTESPETMPRFSRHYDPTAPEVRERRKRLFEAIKAGHTKESEKAMEDMALENLSSAQCWGFEEI
jgi:hypothetical protein